MTTKRVLWSGAVVFGLLLAVYWSRQQQPTSTAIRPVASANTPDVKTAKAKSVPAAKPMPAQVAKSFAIAPDQTAPVPRRFQLPGVERVRTASSFQDWVAQFPPDEQKKITAFNERYFGVFSVNSPQQVAWMAEMGYPMPEDIIAAAYLSDQDLRAMASHGNDKAGFLLHEREVDTLQAKYAELAAKGQTRDQFWRNDPAAAQFNQDDSRFNQLLENSTSPFKGFVQARDAVLDEDPEYTSATVISGLMWAQNYGDFRVNQLIDNYVGNDPRRMAILFGAQAMSINDSKSLSALRNLGCPGFNVGNMIPGNFAPVR